MRFDIRILKNIYPSVICTASDGIHLTFDDGPHPVATQLVLDILRKRNIRATFFLVGQSVQKYPDIAGQINEEGHQIGNHTYSHANLLFKKRAFVEKEILKTEEILKSVIGKHSLIFRPPFGYFNLTTLKVVKENGLKCILWSIDSKDYRIGTTEKIGSRILKHTANGDILLFHDNNKTVLKLQEYFPTLLDTLIEKGFVFNTLPS